MSRLIFPNDFNSQVSLLTAVDAKNTADGASSPLKHYLTQHNINLTALAAATTTATAHDVSRITLVKQANNYRQLRDMKFEPVFTNIKKEVQFLKSLFGSNFSELGAWGVPIDANGKITYPTSFTDRKNLFGAFYAKHSSYTTGESPLQVFLSQQNIDMAVDATAVQDATGYDSSYSTATKQAVNETQMRDLIWQPIAKNLRGIGDFLKNLYVNNDRQLGLWGFKVDNSIVKPAIRTTKLKLGEQKTVNSIVLGTTLNNIGTVDIIVYKGKVMNGTSAVVKPGEKIGMEKGWSAITVVNTSKLETAVFQVNSYR